MSAGAENGVPRVVRIMAAAAGIVGANVHYSQPLVPLIAASLGAAPVLLGAVPAVTQVGFALSILFVLPLADVLDRRRLILGTILVAAFALFATSLATTVIWIVVAAFFVGAGSVTPQALSPFAASIAPASRAGQASGLVLSGILLGVLLSKVVAGIVAETASWRWLFLGAGVAMLVVFAVLARTLPASPVPSQSMTFRQLVLSPFSLLKRHTALRVHGTLGAAFSFMFMLFWGSYALHLNTQFGFGALIAGLFGLAGIAGSLLAPLAGRLVDRGRALLALSIASAAILLAFVILWLGTSTAALIVAGLFVLDAAVGIAHSTNQARVFRIDPSIRSRLNSVYMFSYFIGGAIGAVVGIAAYSWGGWGAVCGTGIVVSVGAIGAVARWRALFMERVSVP